MTWYQMVSSFFYFQSLHISISFQVQYTIDVQLNFYFTIRSSQYADLIKYSIGFHFILSNEQLIDVRDNMQLMQRTNEQYVTTGQTKQ